MKMMLLVFGSMLTQPARAEPVSFEDLWSRVQQNSPVLSREQHVLRAAEMAASRAEKHWLPSLTLGASAFSTNDPGSNFFSILSQRQISSLDFTPSNLNQPGNHTYETVGLGLDLPLYEGGRRIADLEARSRFSEAQSFNQKAALLGEYVESVLNYARLTSFFSAHARLAVLSTRVNELLSHYAIGSRSNPVGYSGLLGLRSLKNRIEGELLTVQSREVSSKEWLSVKAKLKERDWSIRPEETIPFLERAISIHREESPSFSESSLQSRSLAMDAMRRAEKSRFLPRVGLFANESLVHGSRDGATSFTGGLYLKWSLFDPDGLNQVSEKTELQLAASSEVEVAKQSSEMGRKSLTQRERATRQSLALLLESEGLLAEQVRVTSRLFQSGAISALQFAELLNRRVDLILNLMEAEQGLIEVHGNLALLSSQQGVN